MELTVRLRRLHEKQREIRGSRAKRKIVRAGRRGGKTTVAADEAIERFISGQRVLYAAPTEDQVDRFWFEVKRALAEPIAAGVLYKNETRHIIELSNTEQRIRAKTAWNADTLRGDYGDYIILDEFQMMTPNLLDEVVYPMLIDNDGDLLIIYTERRGARGAHARQLFRRALDDETGRWQTFVFSSHDNPYISTEALAEITNDMTNLAYRAEILAEEIADDPDALWKRAMIDHVTRFPELERVVVGVDPTGSVVNECGIVVAGVAQVNGEQHGYVIEDASCLGSPAQWGAAAVTAYHRNLADRMVAERNYGGDMVERTIRTVDGGDEVAFANANATRGKLVRAEPVAALYERGRIHHVGEFPELEDEMCNYVPGRSPSPNRMDALVWCFTELMLSRKRKTESRIW